MNGRHLEPLGAGAGPIEPFLLRCGQEGFSGILQADGSPGGNVRFSSGLVISAFSPAAPGPESLLLRSGRITEEDWTRAYSAGAPTGHLADELVKISSLGVAGLESVCLSAVFDAVFAIALCGVGDVRLDPAGPGDLAPPLPAQPGVDPQRLVRETVRRLATTATWRPMNLTFRSRPVATAAFSLPVISSTELRRAILKHANGRRTARDIAFALGRGLFAVLTEIAHMVEDGLLTLDRGRRAPEPPAAPERAELPQRRPGTSKVVETLPATGKTSLPRRLLGLRGIHPPSGDEEV
ncbi:hypothetical protein [Sphaerisporangium aureirubrum]|uniref:DUF4388 domain-containing protein n=1 Tax=Sphaerisporangium aureirubrum TaxID=1544736 RepID=A0ABW1NXI8_9ACTN